MIYNWTMSSAEGGSGPATGTIVHELVGQNDVNGVDGGTGVADARFGAAIDMEFYGGKYTLVVGAPGEDVHDTTWNSGNEGRAARSIYTRLPAPV